MLVSLTLTGCILFSSFIVKSILPWCDDFIAKLLPIGCCIACCCLLLISLFCIYVVAIFVLEFPPCCINDGGAPPPILPNVLFLCIEPVMGPQGDGPAITLPPILIKFKYGSKDTPYHMSSSYSVNCVTLLFNYSIFTSITPTAARRHVWHWVYTTDVMSSLTHVIRMPVTMTWAWPALWLCVVAVHTYKYEVI